MDCKTYNIFEIAQMAKASISSISRYFTNPGKMRNSLKKRIDVVIEKTGYYPNPNARALGKLNGSSRR